MSYVHRYAHLMGRHGQKPARACCSRRHRTFADERLLDFKKERGWKNLQIYSDTKGDYTRAYVTADDGDVPGLTVFTRIDRTIRHFWSGEMTGEMADPGQDPAEQRISIPYGRSSTSHPQAAAPPGTQSLNTPA